MKRQSDWRFVFRLAGHLKMTVRDMLGRMSAQELGEWRAFEFLEPWAEERADLRSAIIAQAIVAVNSRKVPKLADFMAHREPTTARERAIDEANQFSAHLREYQAGRDSEKKAKRRKK